MSMSIDQVLEAVKSGKLTIAEASALLPNNSSPQALRCKVSEKGAVSVYGLQARFPVTLYGDQWTRLFANREMIEQFMADNKSKLSTKPAKE
jgi:hypothetical protein